MFFCNKNVCNFLNTAFQIFNVVTKHKCHLWRYTFKKSQKYLYNCKNLKKNFIQLRCSNVLLHLKCILPLYKPEIESENLPGAKALATDHRDSFLKRLEGQQNIGYFLSLFSVIAIIKWYWTKRQLFSHGKLFFLFLCCMMTRKAWIRVRRSSELTDCAI